MNHFYLIRHGECDCGQLKLLGRTDAHLNDRGVEQAKRLSVALRDIQFDRIISSPVMRAMQTAQLIALLQQREVTVDDSFQEISYGKWTDKSFSELRNDKLWDKFNRFRAFSRIPDGEMMIDVQCRVVEKMEKLRREPSDQAVCIVSHSDPIKAILSYYCAIDVNAIHGLSVDNGSVSVLDMTASTVSIGAVNYTGHLI